MDDDLINKPRKALEKVMDVIAALLPMGENIFLSEQANTMSYSIDEIDDALIVLEDHVIDQIGQAQDMQTVRSLCSDLREIRAKRAKLDAADDQLHGKIESYTKAVSKIYDKAHTLLKRACSALDHLVEFMTGICEKRKAV